MVPHILAPLKSAEMLRKPQQRMTKPLNIAVVLAFPKTHIGTKPFQDAVLQESTGLMLQYLDTFSGSIAFPELAVPIQAFLKTFLKKCKSAEIKRALKSLAEQLDANAAFILKERSTAEHSPLQTEKNEQFEARMREMKTPLQKHFQLWQAHEERKRKLLQSHGVMLENDDGANDGAGAGNKKSGTKQKQKQGQDGEDSSDEEEDGDGSASDSDWDLSDVNDYEEDDEGDGGEQEPANKRSKKNKKKVSKKKKQQQQSKHKKPQLNDDEGDGDDEKDAADNNLDWMFD